MDQAQIDNLLADKLALDQMYGDTVRALHECKKQLILMQDSVRKLTEQASKQLEEISALKKELEAAKETQLHVIALESKENPNPPETIY